MSRGKLISLISHETATEKEITEARRIWQDDDLEIDEGAAVSRDTETNTGYWVAAWVWIDNEKGHYYARPCAKG